MTEPEPTPPAEVEAPLAQNGALILGQWTEEVAKLVTTNWPFLELQQLGPTFVRVDTSRSARGVCPGFNDTATLKAISEIGPDRVVIGFFCDGEAGIEGVRIWESGRETLRSREEWATATTPDSVTWPISRVATMLGIPWQLITQVKRPSRPPLTLALEALHRELPVEDEALRRAALDVLGHTLDEPAEAILLRYLKAEDWVDRTHAVRSYARVRRAFGEGDHPTIPTLLDDEDEAVREAVFEGLQQLIGDVEFSDTVIHGQIDEAITRGLSDEDEDVQAAAAQAQELRKSLLG